MAKTLLALLRHFESRCQVGFGFSASGTMPKQRANQECLQYDQRNATNDVPPKGLPDRGLPIQHDASRRQGALLYSPVPKGTPIEHVDVVARNDRDILRLLTIENPHRHSRSDAS